MNTVAYSAIETAWDEFVQVRALTPWMTGGTGPNSVSTPGYYKGKNCVSATVKYDRPLTAADIDKLRNASRFINRSFIIAMSAILEAHGIVPNGEYPDTSLSGGLECELVKRLRHCFAHRGDVPFNPSDKMHKKANDVRQKVFPKSDPFALDIDKFLEPLKNRVLEYIRAAT